MIIFRAHSHFSHQINLTGQSISVLRGVRHSGYLGPSNWSCLTSSTDSLSPNVDGAPTALRYLNPKKPAFDGDLACRMLYDPSWPVTIKLTSIGRQYLHDRAMSIHELSESMGRAKLSVASKARTNATFLISRVCIRSCEEPLSIQNQDLLVRASYLPFSWQSSASQSSHGLL